MNATATRVFSRWTVLRNTAPAKRRPSESNVRERVLCRCVCGCEQIVWMEDLKTERSKGCSSTLCRSRWEAANVARVAMNAALDRWLVEAAQAERLQVAGDDE